MNVVDICIIVLILIYVAKGFASGLIKELVTFVGGFAVILLAFLLKNPISVYMYENLPFFKFSGMLSGISVLNIIIYEVLAFLIVAAILLIIYKLVIKLSNILETILKITIILEIPSKILGAIVGFVEGVIITFLVLFACVQFDLTRDHVLESKYGDMVLTKTPILSKAINPIYSSLKEIYQVAEDFKDSSDRNAANLECLDILLKYEVLDYKNAQVLIDNGKLTMPGAQELVDKYKGGTND